MRGALLGCALMALVARPPMAQDAPAPDDSIRVRFTFASDGAQQRWTGLLERVTRDSIVLRVAGADTLALFPRTGLKRLQRHRTMSVGRNAGRGCLVVGAFAGVLGVLMVMEGDEFAAPFPLVSAALGCGLGALAGVVTGALYREWWEPFELPAPAESE
jgi:hypothetical protein